jgi:hypothetical protein
MLILLLLALTPEVRAWDQHQLILERMMDTPVAAQKPYLSVRIRVPCQEEEKKELERVANQLQVNGSRIPLFSTTKCGKKPGVPQELTLRELLTSEWTDEPDRGMDQDLPESADPDGDRTWMGGVSGPTSQGFRHMVFPGFHWSAPLTTLQFPLRALGQAEARIAFLRAAADRYLESKNWFWGARILAWQIHLMQDLHQPFHVVQIPDARMLPWSSLLRGFLSRSTVTMANYHYAYEALALEWLREHGEGSLSSCLGDPDSRIFEFASELPLEPRKSSRALGALLLEIFGDYPKSSKVNLPEGIGQIDMFGLIRGQALFVDDEESEFLSRQEKQESKRSVRVVSALAEAKTLTCRLFRTLSAYVWGELDRGLSRVSRSSSTGK